MVTQLQSKITTHVLLPRGAFLIPQGTTAADSSTLGQRQQQEGWKMSHTSPAAGREAMRKTHSSHQCLQRPLPFTSKLKAGQHLGWPFYPHSPDWVTAQQDGAVTCTASALMQWIHFSQLFRDCPSVLMDTHCSSAWTKVLPTCRNPLLSTVSSSATGLSPAWEAGDNQPHPRVSSVVEPNSRHAKYNPGIFIIVQSGSFLIRKNETNGILFLWSWFSKTESHWIKDGFATCQLFWNWREGIWNSEIKP